MSEKAIAIGMYFVASGIFVVIGQSLPVEGSRRVVDLLTRDFEKWFGATWAFEPDPVKAAHRMIDHIDRKRAGLGLPPPMYEVPYAPKTVAVPAGGLGHPEPDGRGLEPAMSGAPSCRGAEIRD